MATTPTPIPVPATPAPTPVAPPAPTPITTPATPPASPASSPTPLNPIAAMNSAVAARLTAEGLPVPIAFQPKSGAEVPTPAGQPPVSTPPAPAPAVPAPTGPASTPTLPTTEPTEDEFTLQDPDTVPPVPPTEPIPPVDPSAPTPVAAPQAPADTPTTRLADLLADPSVLSVLADPTTAPGQFQDAANKIRQSFLATNNGRRLLSHAKGLADLAKPLESGGIGIEPTPDQIRNWHQSDIHLSNLTAGIESGDPARATTSLRSLFTTPDPLNPDQSILRPGLESTAPLIFEEIATLARAANRPDIYQRAVAPVHEAKFNALLEWVRTTYPGGEAGTEAQGWRDVMIAAVAKIAPFYGRQITKDDFQARPADPSARLAEENRRLHQHIQTQDNQRVSQAWEGFLDSISTAATPRLNSYVDQSLAFVKGRYEPPVYNSLHSNFKDQVVQELVRDPHYNREVDPLLSRIRQTGAFLNGHSTDLIKQVVQIQDRHLQRIVTANRTRFANSLRGETSTPSTAPPVQPAPSAAGGLTPAQQQAQAQARAHATGGPAPTSPTSGGGILPPAPQKFTVPRGMDPVDAIAANIRSLTGTR